MIIVVLPSDPDFGAAALCVTLFGLLHTKGRKSSRIYILLLGVACFDGLMYICTLHYLTGMLYSRKWYKLDIFLSTYISFAVSSWICTNLMCVNVPPCLAVGILKT